jgi:hypothetical protein
VSGSVYSVLRPLCEQCLEERGRDDDDGVAIAPLEMRRRRVRRSAGLLLMNPKPSDARMATVTEPLMAESPAFRRHQDLVKTGHCNVDEDGHNREGGSRSTMPARSADATLWVNHRSGKMHHRYSRLHDRSACGCPKDGVDVGSARVRIALTFECDKTRASRGALVSDRILDRRCPALRRHQGLVKSRAMMMRMGIDR